MFQFLEDFVMDDLLRAGSGVLLYFVAPQAARSRAAKRQRGLSIASWRRSGYGANVRARAASWPVSTNTNFATSECRGRKPSSRAASASGKPKHRRTPVATRGEQDYQRLAFPKSRSHGSIDRLLLAWIGVSVISLAAVALIIVAETRDHARLYGGAALTRHSTRGQRSLAADQLDQAMSAHRSHPPSTQESTPCPLP